MLRPLGLGDLLTGVPAIRAVRAAGGFDAPADPDALPECFADCGSSEGPDCPF